MTEHLPSPETSQAEWFKQESLALLRTQLGEHTYPGYPTKRLTWSKGVDKISTYGRLYLPNGPWHAMGRDQYISGDMAAEFIGQGYQLDADNRPLHPWIDDLLAEDIGVVTGKGFYWHWGANRTADPVIIRTDTPEPMALTVQRADTKQWALAGGFIDAGETAEAAALREAHEETEKDWRPLIGRIACVYSGPLADLRVTANAWPETHAFGIYLDPVRSADVLTEPYVPENDEVDLVAWQSASQVTDQMFGSHRLLVQLALKNL